jgi:hypothetical protein
LILGYTKAVTFIFYRQRFYQMKEEIRLINSEGKDVKSSSIG